MHKLHQCCISLVFIYEIYINICCKNLAMEVVRRVAKAFTFYENEVGSRHKLVTDMTCGRNNNLVNTILNIMLLMSSQWSCHNYLKKKYN